MISLLILTFTTIPTESFFIGDWNGQILDFSSKSGLTYFALSSTYDRCSVVLFNGHWRSEDFKALNCSIQAIHNTGRLLVYSTGISNQSLTIEANITGDIKLSIFNEKSEISGTFSSVPKYLSINFSASEALFDAYIKKIYFFIILFTFLKTLEFYICRQILSKISNRLLAQSMSLSSIILSSTVDLFYLLWSFEIVGKYLSLIEFMILSLSCLVLLREKSRIFDRAVKSQSLSRRRHGFSTYMFISALYITTLNTLYYLNVVASNMVFIPHIVKNLRRRSVSKYLIATLIASQLLLTLSIICWEDNFLVWEPNYYLSAGVVGVVSLQMVYLFKKSQVRDDAALDGDLEDPLGFDEIPILTDSSLGPISASCPICLTDLPPSGLVRTSCMHWFHLSCIQGWLRINSVCPVCRTEVFSLYRR